jgi:hypothetical protein
MSILSAIDSAYQALQTGKQLANPHAWSNAATTKGLLASLITALVGLAHAYDIPIEVSGVDVQSMALGLSSLGMVISQLLHIVSNKNAGL